MKQLFGGHGVISSYSERPWEATKVFDPPAVYGVDCPGWPLATAARQVGASRSVAYLWRDGATVRDKNGSVRHVAPRLPLALKPISPRFLSEEERIRIADLASRGVAPTSIGVMVGGQRQRLVVSFDETVITLVSIGRFMLTGRQHWASKTKTHQIGDERGVA